MNHLNRSYGLKVMAETRKWSLAATRPQLATARSQLLLFCMCNHLGTARSQVRATRSQSNRRISRNFSEIQTDFTDRLERQRNNRRDSTTGLSHLAAGSYQAVMENSWSGLLLWVGDGPPPTGGGPLPKISVSSSFKSETINRGPYPSLRNTPDPLQEANFQTETLFRDSAEIFGPESSFLESEA